MSQSAETGRASRIVHLSTGGRTGQNLTTRGFGDQDAAVQGQPWTWTHGSR